MAKPSAGEYRKTRRHITEPVLQVDTSKMTKAEHHELPPAALDEIKDYLGIPRGATTPPFVSKTQGWVVAILLALLAMAIVVVGYTVIKRDYDNTQSKRDLENIQRQVEHLDKRNMELERVMVELESQIENLKD